jgi:two-component system phosphate regulon sensor histidine kinase PhoR
MKFANPIRLALLISLSVIVFVTLVYLLLVSFDLLPFRLAAILILDLLLFIFTYLLTKNILERFIFEKIKVIYKSIQSLKLSRLEKQALRSGMGEEMIERVGQDVKNWAEGKKAEIEELQKAADYRREFLANVAHEIKTPIANIQGYISTRLKRTLTV